MKNLPLFNKNDKNVRNPNIDCIRIIGMFAIIIHHLIVHGGALAKFRLFSKQILLLNIFCMWHVSSFGIISGLVLNKKQKFSNLLYLWILVIFYSSVFYIKYNKAIIPRGYFNHGVLVKKFSFFDSNFENFLFPVIHKEYWYFTAYFGIYPFLSFIKAGTSNIIRVEQKKSIYFMIGIFIIWSSIYKDNFGQQYGYSSFSLLIFYIIGVYIGKYIFYRNLSIKCRYLTCITCFFIFIMVSLICYYINIIDYFPKLNLKIKNLFKVRINSFPMLIQVITIIIFIAQIKFNYHFSWIITFIGPLTFDIYLIHENPFIKNKYIRKTFNREGNNLNLIISILLIAKKSAYLFIICFFIAYIRNIIFRFFKVRTICANFEKITTKIIDYLI